MKSAIEVLDAFEHIRRAQRSGVYAPHKPLLILWRSPGRSTASQDCRISLL